MRDVIGQDELEDVPPPPGPLSRRQRRRAWAGAVAVAAVAGLAAVVAGGSAAAPDDSADAGRRAAPAASEVGPAATAGGAADPPGRVRMTDPALRAGLAARPLGGDTVRTGVGASGAVRLEVRNGGAALRLLSLTAEVPGVRFSQVVRPNGVELGPEERIELVLGFAIDDCAQLRRTGRLVLLVEQAGVPQEVGLTVTHDREAGTVRQVALDRVLGACPR